MKKLITILSIALMCLSVNSYAQKKVKSKPKPLANKTYTVTITETSSAHPNPWSDEIHFSNDKIDSKVLSRNHNFSPSATIILDDSSTKTIIFTSKAENADKEKIKWDGTVTGKAIEGTIELTGKAGRKTEYTFTGSLKK